MVGMGRSSRASSFSARRTNERFLFVEISVDMVATAR